MSQLTNILKHLETRGSITAMEALELYNCFRLAARINDLRGQGHQITTDEVKLANGKTIARYNIKKEAQHELPL